MTTEGQWLRIADDDPRVIATLRERLEQSMRGDYVSTLVFCPVVAGVLWTMTDQNARNVALWCLLGAATTLAQWAHSRRTSQESWKRDAVCSQLVSALFWGTLPLLLMPTEPVWQTMLSGCVMSVFASVAPFASAVRAAWMAFLGLATPLAVLGFVIRAEGDTRWLAVLISLATLFYAYQSHTLHRSHVEAAVLTATLEAQAHTDELTGAANRKAMLRFLAEHRSGERGLLAIAFMDLDGFKLLNDSRGHAAGDAALITACQRLQGAFGAEDGALVVRMGGDELCVLKPLEERSEIAAMGEHLSRVFAEPFEIDGRPEQVRASIGVVVAESGESTDEVLSRADGLQYTAKRSGGGRVLTELDLAREA